MDSSSQEIYLQKLEELIEDEDKIVTVSSLANTLNISVQDSLTVLNKYLKDIRKLKPDFLAATYILTGNLKNDQGKIVCLVKDCDISKKDEFKEISSEILYSIQKSKNVDFNILALVDWPNFTNSIEKPKPLFGTVISKNCTKRVLKFKILPPPPPPTVKGKSSFFLPKTEPKINSNSAEVNNTLTDAVGNSKSGTITNLFNKKSDNKEIEKKEERKKPASKDKSVKGSLSSFFSKTSSNSSNNGNTQSEKFKNSEDSDLKKAVSEKAFEAKGNENTSSTPTEDIDFGSDIEVKESEKLILEDNKKSNISIKHKKVSNKSNKRAREKSNDKSNKRRKRIIESNDSESDDIFENDENEEDMFEKSDDEPRNPSPIPVKPLAPKNKKRVAVDRSYIDEEGFMVTKKEYVYESASDDESDKHQIQLENTEEKQSQKTIEKKTSTSSDTNTSPPKGGKGKKAKKNLTQNQPTLMNFFKKK